MPFNPPDTSHLEEFIKNSNILPTNIFVIDDKHKQDEYLTDFIVQKELLHPICEWKFVDVGNLIIPMYFAQKTAELLKRFDKPTIKALDAIFTLLVMRRSLVTVNVVDVELLQSFKGVFLLDALFVMKFNDYNILPEKIRTQIKPSNPEHYVLKKSN
jgi:hypothetical protein